MSRPEHGALHHVEIWVPDLERALGSLGWLLETLGYAVSQSWDSGHSWLLGPTYLVLDVPRTPSTRRRSAALRGLPGEQRRLRSRARRNQPTPPGELIRSTTLWLPLPQGFRSWLAGFGRRRGLRECDCRRTDGCGWPRCSWWRRCRACGVSRCVCSPSSCSSSSVPAEGAVTPLPRNMPGCGLWVFAQCGRDAAGARLARGCGGASSAALSGGAHVARGSPVRALWLHARVLWVLVRLLSGGF